MATRELREAVSVLRSWLPSETEEYRTFFWRWIASLPGGEEAEDMGYEPLTEYLGWQEMNMIADLYAAIEGPQDVREAIEMLLEEEEED